MFEKNKTLKISATNVISCIYLKHFQSLTFGNTIQTFFMSL